MSVTIFLSDVLVKNIQNYAVDSLHMFQLIVNQEIKLSFIYKNGCMCQKIRERVTLLETFPHSGQNRALFFMYGHDFYESACFISSRH